MADIEPFPLEVNEARGEVGLWVKNVPVVIAATMKGLSAVSTRLGCMSIQELFLKLSGTEPAATTAAISLLTVRGDAAKAVEVLTVQHFPACARAFAKALAHHFEDDEGNAEAAEGKTT